jgi:hypothetical protein
MSWSDSGQSQPAPNTPRGYGFFAAIFNYIFGKHNALDTTVSGATPAASNATLVERDAKGGANFGANVSTTNASLSAAAPDAVTYGFYGRSFTGGVMAERWQNQAGSADIRTTDAAGNGFYAGTLTVPTGFIGPLTGNVTGNVTGAVSGNAGGLAAPITLTAAIGDYKAGANASANAVTIAAGGGWTDSNGNVIGPLTAQTATLPTQPSGTTVQYVGISLVPTTGTPNTGTPTATLAALTIPVVNKPVCYVIQRGATTNPSGIIAAGDIIDVRNLGGGGAGSGGSGGAPTSASYLVYGTPPGSLPDALDVSSAASNLRLAPALVKYAATDAPILDALAYSVTGNIVGAIAAGGGAGTLVLTAPSPIVVTLPGITREVSGAGNPVALSASGAAGLYNVVADLNTAGVATFAPKVLPASTALTANQVILAQVWWMGSAFDLTNLYYPAFPLLNSSQVKLVTIPEQAYAGGSLIGNSGAAYQVLPNAAPISVNLPRAGMRAVITLAVGIQMASTAVAGAVGLQVSLVPASSFVLSGLTAQENLVGAASTFYKYFVRYEAIIPQAGPLTVEAIYLNTGAFNCTSQTALLWGEFTG